MAILETCRGRSRSTQFTVNYPVILELKQVRKFNLRYIREGKKNRNDANIYSVSFARVDGN